MNRRRLFLFTGFCLFVSVFVYVARIPLNAQEKTNKFSKAELQELMMSFLKDEGYSPSTDRDGDVQFKLEGRMYFIGIDENDPQFFRLVFPGFWPIENEAERMKVMVAANYATSSTKAAKVFLVRDNVWAAVEMITDSPKDFKPVFKRLTSSLQTSVKSFAEKMNELK